MKAEKEEMIDEARMDASRLMDEAARLDEAAALAEEDGNGDPSYLRLSAAGCRDKADGLIDRARELAD